MLLLTACSGSKQEASQQKTQTEEEEQVSVPADNAPRVTIKQGVWGDVLFFSGDFSTSENDGKVEPVARKLYIYEPTKPAQVSFVHRERGSFISKIQTKLVDSTASDDSGFYQLSLPPGRYSLFVNEDSALYANHLSSKGYLADFEVYKDRVAYFRIIIAYDADY